MRKIRFALVLLLTAGASAGFAQHGQSISPDGLCTDLGCTGGETKCADGSFETSDGWTIHYTCYTQLTPE